MSVPNKPLTKIGRKSKKKEVAGHLDRDVKQRIGNKKKVFAGIWIESSNKAVTN